MPYKYNPFTGTLDKVGTGGGSSTFTGLTDTPASYSGEGRKGYSVNAAETALIAVDELTYYPGDNTKALIEISQTKVPTTDRCGAIHTVTTKSSGAVSMAANWFEYQVTDTTGAGFEIASASITIMTTNSGSAVPVGHWVLCIGPTSSTGGFTGIGQEVNYQERIADRGLYTNRAAATFFTAIQNIVPEAFAFAGTGYPVSAGTVYAPSVHGSLPGIYVPIFIAELGIATGGIGMLMQGGTTSANDPRSAVEYTGHFGKGIDFTSATINDTDKPAISLADLHRIFLGTARIYANGNNLTFFDATNDTVTLTEMKSPLTTKGDIHTYDSADARLPVGTDGQALVSDSAETTGLKWTSSVEAFDGGSYLDTNIDTVDFDGGGYV